MNKIEPKNTTWCKIWFLYLCERHLNLFFRFRNKSINYT